MVDQLKGEIVAPNDKFKLVYIIFYWLGIGTLLPWNMFITVCILSLVIHELFSFKFDPLIGSISRVFNFVISRLAGKITLVAAPTQHN